MRSSSTRRSHQQYGNSDLRVNKNINILQAYGEFERFMKITK